MGGRFGNGSCAVSLVGVSSWHIHVLFLLFSLYIIHISYLVTIHITLHFYSFSSFLGEKKKIQFWCLQLSIIDDLPHPHPRPDAAVGPIKRSTATSARIW